MITRVPRIRVSVSGAEMGGGPWEWGWGLSLPTFGEDTVLRGERDLLLSAGGGILPFSSRSCGGLRG